MGKLNGSANPLRDIKYGVHKSHKMRRPMVSFEGISRTHPGCSLALLCSSHLI
jgi:hypothetical protein